MRARRTSTRGNTLLPSTLTLLIGLRVTHSWGCVYVYVYVLARAQQTDKHKLVTHNLGDISKVRGV